MSQNSASNNTKRYTRFPFVRVFIKDLNEGNWNFEENMLESRYGKLKRVRICGTIINKREVIEESQDDSFLVEDSGPNSRISYHIDDGTDRLWATIWNVDVERYEHLKTGTLVDIVGIVRIYNNRIQVTLDYIRAIDDPNIETYHRIEVLKKRKLEPSHEVSKQDRNSTGDFDFDLPDDDFDFEDSDDFLDEDDDFFEDESFDNEISSEDIEEISSKDDNVAINEVQDLDKSDLGDQIRNYIRDNDKDDGISREKLIQKFSIDADLLDEILEKLLQDVEIYKTKPNHFSAY